jgi:hypothetical protein
MDKEEDDTIALLQAGSTDPEKLDDLIDKAWSDAIANSEDRAKIGAILGLTEQEVKKAPPPFRVKVGKAGLTGAELIIIFATAFAVAYVKQLGTEGGTVAAKVTVRQAKEVWRLLKERMLRSEPEALGSEVDESD